MNLSELRINKASGTFLWIVGNIMSLGVLMMILYVFYGLTPVEQYHYMREMFK